MLYDTSLQYLIFQRRHEYSEQGQERSIRVLRGRVLYSAREQESGLFAFFRILIWISDIHIARMM